MGLEAASYVGDLDANNPDGADSRSQGDNHLRLIKLALKNTFPGLVGTSFRIQGRSGNYTALLNDNLSLLWFSVPATLTMPLAATIGNGYCLLALAGGGPLIVSAATGETVNGSQTFTVPAGQTALILCTGSTFIALVIPTGPTAAPAWSTGDVKPTFKTAADIGWVMMNDGSIGSAASGGTSRANADCKELFILLWNNVSNTWAPVSGGRGGNADSDWALNKTLTLPRTLGRALAVAGTGSGLTARALGERLGTETHSLTQNETPVRSHTHTVNDPGHSHLANQPDGTGEGIQGIGSSAFPQRNFSSYVTQAALTGISIQATGDASVVAHNNMPPEFFLNVMIKL